MIADFADRCTYIYVLVDALYQVVVAPYDTHPGPSPAFSDSALIALTLAAELPGLDAEARFLTSVRRNHPTLFPLLPERSRYNRRHRQLIEASDRVRGVLRSRLWRVSEVEGHDTSRCSTVPVPVVGYHRAVGAHRWWGEADCGRGPATQQRIYGFKLHPLIAHNGLVLDFALALANHHEGALTAQLLEEKAGLIVIGDKGYSNGPLQAHLAALRDLALLPPSARTSGSRYLRR